MEGEKERRPLYNGSNSKRPKERKTVLCLLVKQVCQSQKLRGEHTYIHTHTYTLSHRQLVWPLRLTVPIAELFLFNWESARRVVHCNDNDGALLCMKMRQTAKREKRLVHRRRQSRGCGRSHRSQGKKTGSQSGQLGKCRCCCCCSWDNRSTLYDCAERKRKCGQVCSDSEDSVSRHQPVCSVREWQKNQWWMPVSAPSPPSPSPLLPSSSSSSVAHHQEWTDWLFLSLSSTLSTDCRRDVAQLAHNSYFGEKGEWCRSDAIRSVTHLSSASIGVGDQGNSATPLCTDWIVS